MAFINTNHGEIKIDKQMNVTVQQSAAETPTSNNNTGEEDVDQMSNRQLIILMTAIMDLSLDPTYLNQKAFARLLSAVSGKKVGGIRQSVMDARKDGFETKESRQDMLAVAALLEKIKPEIAEKLRNDAED